MTMLAPQIMDVVSWPSNLPAELRFFTQEAFPDCKLKTASDPDFTIIPEKIEKFQLIAKSVLPSTIGLSVGGKEQTLEEFLESNQDPTFVLKLTGMDDSCWAQVALLASMTGFFCKQKELSGLLKRTLDHNDPADRYVGHGSLHQDFMNRYGVTMAVMSFYGVNVTTENLIETHVVDKRSQTKWGHAVQNNEMMIILEDPNIFHQKIFDEAELFYVMGEREMRHISSIF
jgi:hypothetical protein